MNKWALLVLQAPRYTTEVTTSGNWNCKSRRLMSIPILRNLLMRQLLRSKIHRAVVTEANPDYVGSITIDPEMMDAVGLWAFEKVLVVSVTSGARLETYTMKGEAGSGEICINGGAAHLIQEGEIVIIMAFELSEKPVDVKIALVNEKNEITQVIEK